MQIVLVYFSIFAILIYAQNWKSVTRISGIIYSDHFLSLPTFLFASFKQGLDAEETSCPAELLEASEETTSSVREKEVSNTTLFPSSSAPKKNKAVPLLK